MAGWGRDKFMTVSNLMNVEKGFYANEVVIFKTEITVYSELEHEDTLDNPIAIALKNQTLTNCLRSLFTADLGFSDVTLQFADTTETLSAHKCILVARSPVFRAMFASQMKECQSGEIMIHDIEIDTMRELLTYMYTDSFSEESILDTQAGDLLMSATKYEVLGVIHQCELALIQQVTEVTVIELLAFADAYTAQKLKGHCIQYLGTLNGDIFKSVQFQQLPEDLMNECINTLEKTLKCGMKHSGNTSPDKKATANCIVM